MKQHILHTAIFLTFYILGAYATTDILRLLKGSTVPVNAQDCYCPVCHKKIALWDQIPIISYIRNRGTCHNCKSPIPISDLFLEIFLFLLLSIISCVLHYSWTAFWICVALYESTKTGFLLYFGKREDAWLKNLFMSLFTNLLLFGCVAFLFWLTHII